MKKQRQRKGKATPAQKAQRDAARQHRQSKVRVRPKRTPEEREARRYKRGPW